MNKVENMSKEEFYSIFNQKTFDDFFAKETSLQDTTEEVEMLCPHCWYATIPFKVNKPSEPYWKSLKDTTEERECECSEETIDKYEWSFDFTYCPECWWRILRENR